MPTKDELVTFAEVNGIAVDPSALKADIEDSIRGAGYDPTTLEPLEDITVSETEDAGAQALEQGYLGTVPDAIENEAYTVEGQGPETAQREREQITQLRAARWEVPEA